MKTAAIYARVSSDQQKEDNTIASQTAALKEFAAEAAVVGMVYENDTVAGLSIGAIARLLNDQGVPTRHTRRRVGNAPGCGTCCAIRPTGAAPASARRRRRPANG